MMKSTTTVKVAIKALLRNPTRALLTTLGIVIGIAAVIAMMEIGKGSSESIRTSIEKMGANTVLVMPGAPRMGGVRQSSGSQLSLTQEDCRAILRDCPHVGQVAPVVSVSSCQAIFGSENYSPNRVNGSTPAFLEIRNWSIAEGRSFTTQEVENSSRVCLVGSTIVRELFKGESPIDCELRIKNTSFHVIGVLKSKGANMMGFDEDDVIIMPWTTARMRLSGLKSGSSESTTSTAASTPGELYSATGVALYPEPVSSMVTDTLLKPKFINIDQILFTGRDSASVNAAVDEVTQLLRERHRLKADQPNDFHIRNSAEFMRMLTGTSTVMTNLLLAVALISLIVGGVGIMNIMLVSVTERTREIGLRMAVGARSRDILKQFLIESVILCLVGGIIGILLGHGAALLVEKYLNWPVASSTVAVISAVGVSAAVGVLFGFYPAWKAANLDPIDALRYE
ncbi:MAG: ABC transporter permease [Victivallaceae bacterium]|nr:ABC transporter permease [Victivallaceae bacterium]